MAKEPGSEVRIQRLAELAERLLGSPPRTPAMPPAAPVDGVPGARLQADDEVRIHVNVALRGVLLHASPDTALDAAPFSALLDTQVLIASWNDQVTRSEMSLRWGLIHARHPRHGRVLALFSEIEWLERFVGGGICRAWLTPLRQALDVVDVLGFDGVMFNPGSARAGTLSRAQASLLRGAER